MHYQYRCVVISIRHSLTHTLTHSLTHSCTHSLTHSLIHSLTHAHTHSFTHSLIHSLTHTLTHSLTHSCTHSLIHSLTHSLTHTGEDARTVGVKWRECCTISSLFRRLKEMTTKLCLRDYSCHKHIYINSLTTCTYTRVSNRTVSGQQYMYIAVTVYCLHI